MNDRFTRQLQSQVVPLLHQWGYEFNPQESQIPVLHSYQKRLLGGVLASVEFQRHTYEECVQGYDFRINLRRIDPVNTDYEGALYATIFQVLSTVYDIQDIGSTTHWFVVPNSDDIDAKLNEAMMLLKIYGIPWVEDPNTRGLTHIGYELRKKVASAISENMVETLGRNGYSFETLDNLHIFHFYKNLVQGKIAHIVLQLMGGSPPHYPAFYIWMIKNSSDSPHDFRGADLYCDLGGIINSKRAAPSDFLSWQLTGSVSIEKQLADALSNLQSVGIPWLEDTNSVNPIPL